MPRCTCILITFILFYFAHVEVARSEELLPVKAEDKIIASGADSSEERYFVNLEEDDEAKVISIAKRYLRWQSNNIQPTPDGDLFEVRFFKPHEMSERVNINEDYSGFTLYRRDGADIEANTGIFHFVKTNDARTMAGNCVRQTLHAGAYRYIYGVCPEADSDLVASGHCHFAGGDLRFNSGAFNSIQSYSDDRYYENDNREMNSVEQNFFTKCFSDWKDAGYSMEYMCEVSSFIVVSTTQQFRPREVTSYERQGASCQDCDSMCNSAQSIIAPFAFTFISAVLQKAII